MRNKSRVSIFLIIAAMALVAVPAMALAQDSLTDPSAAQYDTPIPDAEATAGETGSASAGGSSGGLDSNIGSLPFTGMDLIIVAGVAFVLTGTGFALRRLSTPRGPRV